MNEHYEISSYFCFITGLGECHEITKIIAEKWGNVLEVVPRLSSTPPPPLPPWASNNTANWRPTQESYQVSLLPFTFVALVIVLGCFCCCVVQWKSSRRARGSLWLTRRRVDETVAAAASPRFTLARCTALFFLSLSLFVAFLCIPQTQRAASATSNALFLLHTQLSRMASAAAGTANSLSDVRCPSNASTTTEITCTNILADCANATSSLRDASATLHRASAQLRVAESASVPLVHWTALVLIFTVGAAVTATIVHACYWGRNGQGPTTCTRLSGMVAVAALAVVLLVPGAMASGAVADACPLAASTVAVAANLDANETALALYYLECGSLDLPPSSTLARLIDELDDKLVPAVAGLIAWANMTDPSLAPIFESDAMSLAEALVHLESLADCEQTSTAFRAARDSLCTQIAASLPTFSLLFGLILGGAALVGLAAAEVDRCAAHAKLVKGLRPPSDRANAWRAGVSGTAASADELDEEPPLEAFGANAYDCAPLLSGVKASYDTFGTDETWDDGSFRK